MPEWCVEEDVRGPNGWRVSEAIVAMESRRLRPVVRSRRRFLADRFAGTAKAPDFSLIPEISPLGCLSSRDWPKFWGINEKSGALGV